MDDNQEIDIATVYRYIFEELIFFQSLFCTNMIVGGVLQPPGFNLRGDDCLSPLDILCPPGSHREMI